MSLGAYDEDEHLRREQKNGEVAADFDDERTVYQGTVEFEDEESTEDLLDQFKEMKD
jgi:hypothetical protein